MKTGKHIFKAKYRDRQGNMQETAVWHMRYWHAGKKYIRSTGETDRAKAEAVYFRALADCAERLPASDDPLDVTIGQLLDLVIDDYRLKKRKTTYETERKISSILRPRLGALKAAEFGTRQIKAYIAERSGETVWSTAATKGWKGKREKALEPATINRELATIRRAFTLGYEHDPPLVARVPKFPMLTEDNVREGVLAHDGYLCLRGQLSPHARLALVIAYHTGARRGEILSIEHRHVDLKAGRILMPGRLTKNKKPKYIPIYGDMRGEIEAAVAMAAPKCHLLVQRNGQRVEDIAGDWETGCRACGLGEALFHDLRRTALTNMIEAGFSEKEAMEISGHKTAAVFRRYHIVSEARSKQAGERMEEFMRKRESGAKFSGPLIQ